MSNVHSPINHEGPARVSHVLHLQVGGGRQDPRNSVGVEGQSGCVHEVKQQGNAGNIQAVGQREGHPVLPMSRALAPLHNQCVEVATVKLRDRDRQG